MDFKKQTFKEAQAWIRYITPMIKFHSYPEMEVVIIGLGTGEHIDFFNKEFPECSITLIDPRKQTYLQFYSRFQRNIRYISTLEGVQLLKQELINSLHPIPILEYRPAWYPEKIFFQWTHSELMGFMDWNHWKESRSHFILESLFV